MKNDNSPVRQLMLMLAKNVAKRLAERAAAKEEAERLYDWLKQNWRQDTRYTKHLGSCWCTRERRTIYWPLVVTDPEDLP